MCFHESASTRLASILEESTNYEPGGRILPAALQKEIDSTIRSSTYTVQSQVGLTAVLKNLNVPLLRIKVDLSGPINPLDLQQREVHLYNGL